jgi:hypothetical protein
MGIGRASMLIGMGQGINSGLQANRKRADEQKQQDIENGLAKAQEDRLREQAAQTAELNKIILEEKKKDPYRAKMKKIVDDLNDPQFHLVNPREVIEKHRQAYNSYAQITGDQMMDNAPDPLRQAMSTDYGGIIKGDIPNGKQLLYGRYGEDPTNRFLDSMMPSPAVSGVPIAPQPSVDSSQLPGMGSFPPGMITQQPSPSASALLQPVQEVVNQDPSAKYNSLFDVQSKTDVKNLMAMAKDMRKGIFDAYLKGDATDWKTRPERQRLWELYKQIPGSGAAGSMPDGWMSMGNMSKADKTRFQLQRDSLDARIDQYGNVNDLNERRFKETVRNNNIQDANSDASRSQSDEHFDENKGIEAGKIRDKRNSVIIANEKKIDGYFSYSAYTTDSKGKRTETKGRFKTDEELAKNFPDRFKAVQRLRKENKRLEGLVGEDPGTSSGGTGKTAEIEASIELTLKNHPGRATDAVLKQKLAQHYGGSPEDYNGAVLRIRKRMGGR